MFKSATFKLTMWYLAIAMAISLIFSVVVYNVATGELSRGLTSESQSLYNRFPVFIGDPRFGFHPDKYYDSSAHRILFRLILFNVLVLIGAGYSSYWLAKRTLQPIEEAHEHQKRFTADVSHELRTPLTAIKMESEVALLNPKASAKELKSTLSSNLEEVGKLESLINNLLRLTKLEAHELEQNFEEINAEQLVNEALNKVSQRAKNKHINIVSKLSYNPKIKVDRDSWTQLLAILLDNAIKYSPGKSNVRLETSKKDSQTVFRVIDEGRGIAPKALERVFDRFYRADDSRKKNEEGGYGLGLSIAKMIADLHGATISITSELNHGTTAEVHLPINKADS